MQLPPISLPKFNGNIQDWPSFYDVFKAMVHYDEQRKTLLTTSNNPQRPGSCFTESHKLFTCEIFKALKISTRLDFVRTERLCFNCLASFHNAVSWSCKKCSKKHNTMLQFKGQQASSAEKSSGSDNDSVVAESSQRLPKVFSAQRRIVFL